MREKVCDDDDDLKSYVRPLLQLETVTSVLVIRSDKQFSFQIMTDVDVRWQLRIGAGREFQVDGPATAELRGPYRSVLVAGMARSPRAFRSVSLDVNRWDQPHIILVRPLCVVMQNLVGIFQMVCCM